LSCSRAAVRKMAPRGWVNSAWVMARVVNQSDCLGSFLFAVDDGLQRGMDRIPPTISAALLALRHPPSC